MSLSIKHTINFACLHESGVSHRRGSISTARDRVRVSC
jgi:hypothetical protein